MTQAARLDPSPDYLKTYSLRTEPFATSVDGRFFYAGAELTQRLDLLIHLARFGDAVVLVSGPPGSGKTTLLRRFIRQTTRQWRLCALDAQDIDQFRQRLGDALGVGDGRDEQDILRRWAERGTTSRLLVVAIDDAQQLNRADCEKLFRLLDSPLGERVRLILFGTPELQQTVSDSLEHRQRQHNTRVLEIPRLSDDETGCYLMYRLAVAGYNGENPFPVTEIRAINKAADGRPAAINRLAHVALREHQFRHQARRFRPTHPEHRKLGAFWLLAAVLIAVSLVWLVSERLRPSPPVPAAPGDADQVFIPAPVPSTQQLQASTPAVVDPIGSLPVPPQRQVSLRYALAPVAVPERPEYSAMSAPVPLRLASEQTSPLAPAIDEFAETGIDATQPADIVAGPADSRSAPAAAPETQTIAPPATSDPDLPALPDTVTPPVSGGEPRPASTATASETETAGETFPRREAWLLLQADNRYSLQLLGARQEQSILAYLDRHGLDPEQCAWYRGTFQGAAWYVLLYGLYPNRDAAVAARSGLPEGVRKGKPWPRSMASVHSAIREAE